MKTALIMLALTASAADAATRCVFVGQAYVCTTDRGQVATGVCIQLVSGRIRCL
jgi:hypothetical protein